MIKKLLYKIADLKLNLSESQKDFGIIPLVYSRIREKELMHSDILAELLEFDFLAASFFDTIQLDSSILQEGYTVHKEYTTENQRRIDILITIGSDKAVIIENKLNNATDQSNQLQDYNKSLELQNRRVIKSVYIPLYATKRVAHDSQIKEKINIYPSDLIEWMQRSKTLFENDRDFNPCTQYQSLLEYINTINKNMVNADKLLQHLLPEELEQILDLSVLVTSADWHKNKLIKIQQQIEKREDKKNIQFDIKEKSGYIYLEIWMKEYKYWIQVYSNTKDFTLYLVANTEDTQTAERISSLGFQYSSDWDGVHCYKHQEKFRYSYLGEAEKLNSLCDEILDLIHQSVF